ncbi:hypothetical protein V1478_009309 [Vespula squamosa]|uniref:Uncharacterized protein n=1 Tax=Vespula squamosa TaxID=30214 RepID=A0ABD2AP96_VESSQ
MFNKSIFLYGVIFLPNIAMKHTNGRDRKMKMIFVLGTRLDESLDSVTLTRGAESRISLQMSRTLVKNKKKIKKDSSNCQ